MKEDSDGKNIIYCNSEHDPLENLAETFVEFGESMYDSDIVFYQCPKIYDTLACSDGSDKCKGDIDKVDIVTLALHEIGHFFGFAHV